MEEDYFKKLTATLILFALVVLSFFLVKPILLSVIGGLILAFIFSPIYDFFFRLTKGKTISAIIVCISILIAIIAFLWFFAPMILNESINLYVESQELDLVTPLKSIFPSLFASEEFSAQTGRILENFFTKITNSLMTYISDLIMNFPTIILHIFVVFFTFFYVLKDKENLKKYLLSLLPFSKDIEKKLFESTKDITFSVLYGQLVVGAIQGVILSIGLFLFKVPNAILLSLIGVVAGILPIIGPSLVGVPVAISFIIGGNVFPAAGILVFTFLSSFSDNLFRPLLVSKRVKLHTSLVLIGMIGGFLMFGLLGFVLGPLIIAYLVIIIEVYRNKALPGVFIQEPGAN